MLFNSLAFLAFLPVVLTGALLLRGTSWRLWVLAASYVFYGVWDERFLLLIAASTVVDFWAARHIARSDDARTRRAWLLVSIITNLGILAFFKYSNFFLESLDVVLRPLGTTVAAHRLDIILPVGISFYTFQTLSYTIDVYRGTTKPAESFVAFATYVAFFPQLVAGPIERSSNLLPQLQRPAIRPSSTQVDDALWLIAAGFAKKVFIADNLAVVVNQIFALPSPSGGAVMLGAVAFAFQIYGDFSGYSDIARGVSKLMGVDLMLNFRSPYLASGPADFWRRWHISLSTWLRDYLYVPLGGSRRGTGTMYRNLMLTMGLGGLWHGAGWTFLVWGIYQGSLLVAERAFYGKPPPHPKRFTLSIGHVVRTGLTFAVVCVGWLIFRAESGAQLLEMGMALIQTPTVFSGVRSQWFLGVALFSGAAMAIQAAEERSAEAPLAGLRPAARAAVLLLLSYASIILGAPGENEFIYFQF